MFIGFGGNHDPGLAVYDHPQDRLLLIDIWIGAIVECAHRDGVFVLRIGCVSKIAPDACGAAGHSDPKAGAHHCGPGRERGNPIHAFGGGHAIPSEDYDEVKVMMLFLLTRETPLSMSFSLFIYSAWFLQFPRQKFNIDK